LLAIKASWRWCSSRDAKDVDADSKVPVVGALERRNDHPSLR